MRNRNALYSCLIFLLILGLSSCGEPAPASGYAQSYQVPNAAVEEIYELFSEDVLPEKAKENREKARAVFDREYGRFFSEEGAEKEWLSYPSELPYACMAAGWSMEITELSTRELKNGGETLEARLTVTKDTGEKEAVSLICSVQLDEKGKITSWKRTGSEDAQRLLLEALGIK